MDMMKKTLDALVENPKYYLRLSVEGILIGLVAGIVVSLYRFLLTSSESLLYSILDFIQGNVFMIAIWFIFLIAMGLIVGYLMRWEPMASGSGIPQVNGEVKGFLDPSWWKILVAKLVGGTLSTLGGLSLGREGPSIQLGAMAAKGVSKVLPTSKTDDIRLIMCGGSAGLAATFNAPLAGVIFTLEEINNTFDKKIILVGLIAAVVADFVSKFFFGQSTIFNFACPNIPLHYYWLLIVLGLLIGFAGFIYNWGMIKASDLWARFDKIPIELRLVITFVITGFVGLYIPSILAGGHTMMGILKTGIPALSVLLVLLVGKYLLSVLSFSSGAPGGIFFPLLVLGAYIGAIFSAIVIPIFGLDPILAYKFIIISMAGMFASTVRAPITGIVLISEMTGTTTSLVALIIVCIVAYIVPNILRNKPIYESLLERILKKNHNIVPVERTDNILSEYIVPLECEYIDKKIWNIPFPKSCVVVSITRSANNIIPDENTRLKYGDELFILIDYSSYAEDNQKIEEIIYK